MNILWFVSQTEDQPDTVTVLGPQGMSVAQINDEHAAYGDLMDYLRGGGEDTEHIARLVNAEATDLITRLTFLTFNLDNIDIDYGHVYINGERTPEYIASHLLSKIQAGDRDYERVVKFWEKRSQMVPEIQQKLDVICAEIGFALDEEGTIYINPFAHRSYDRQYKYVVLTEAMIAATLNTNIELVHHLRELAPFLPEYEGVDAYTHNYVDRVDGISTEHDVTEINTNEELAEDRFDLDDNF